MTVEEAKATMRVCGWTYLPRKRGKQDYVYAERKREGKKVEKYICTRAALERLSNEELKATLGCA